MITENKILIYKKYNGFVDVYIFENGDLPNEDFDISDWSTIDDLIGDIILLKNGKASIEFQNELKQLILQKTENDLVIEYLNKIAEEKLGKSN